MKRFYQLILSTLSGLLLWLSWPVSPYALFIFIAFVPLFFVENFTEKRLLFFAYSYITMLIWNAGTTWWIWNSTGIGAIGAITANSLLMTLPWYGYRIYTRKYGNVVGLLSLIVFWMSFEYIHLNWQLSWPWLTLGNVFAMHPNWVQWYEITGTSGGTLWVLIVNVILYQIIKETISGRFNGRIISSALFFLVTPLLISWSILNQLQKTKPGLTTKYDVIIVQPNIDPYHEKFDTSSIKKQLNILISLSERQLDTNTALVLWPETALSASVRQDEIQKTAVYKPVFDFVNRHSQLTLLTGIETFRVYSSKKATSTAELDKNTNIYYDVLNAAVAIKSNEPLLFYTKGKLVPGVETLPDFLKWMGPLFEQFGGTAGGYAHSDSSSVFLEPGDPFITAPIICYESIYGEYVSTYVKKGANLLTIITNDGWWGNTPGYKQHLHYACLRAIETRRYVARSANTGVSAVIDEKGQIQQRIPWDKAFFIKAEIPALTKITFYVKWGDILSKAALLTCSLFIFFHLFIQLKQSLINRFH